PVRNFRLPRRLKAHTDLVVLQAVFGARSAYDCGAGNLAGQVADETVTADTYNVAGVPFCRRIAEKFEFQGQALGVRAEPVNVGVDAGNKGGGDSLRVRAVRPPFFLHVTAIKKEASCSVLFDVTRAEHLRQIA